jgi:hypothetical protein
MPKLDGGFSGAKGSCLTYDERGCSKKGRPDGSVLPLASTIVDMEIIDEIARF